MANFSIPKTIEVKGKTWTVIYKWNLKLNGEPVAGYYEPNLRHIYIDRLISKEDKFEAFIHEYIHAVLFEYFLYQDGGVGGFVEELICSSISEELLQSFDIKIKKDKK